MKKKRRLLQPDTFWGLAAALLVLLQFWWLPGEDGSAADSYSNTVDGKLGLYRTLTELFPSVERDALHVVPEESATLILVAPDRYPSPDEQLALYQFVYEGGNLLFAPNWLSTRFENGEFTDPEIKIPTLGIHLKYRPRFFARAKKGVPVTPATPATTASETSDTSTPAPSGTEEKDTNTDPTVERSIPTGDVGSSTDSTPVSAKDSSGSLPGSPNATPPMVAPAAGPAVDDEDFVGHEISATSDLVSGTVNFLSTATLELPSHLTTETLLTSASGQAEAATWTIGYGRVLVCSSADLFSNRSLLYQDSRRLAVRLVEHCATNPVSEYAETHSSIVISEYFNATDAFQNTGILFSPSLRIGTLQLLLVAVLGIWMAFHRFGPATEVTNTQRRTLTESAQAVGNLQYRLRDGGVVVRGYLEYMSSHLRRRYGSQLRMDQADQIAGRAGMDPEEVRRNLAEAQQMAVSTQLSSARAAASIRWLAKLQQRLSGNSSQP
jgi:hypothetical protein